MNNLVIPPSPSWYLSNIIACNDSGVVAYGARHEVVIIKIKTESEITPYTFEYDFIPLAHKDRITCLTFAPNNVSDNFKNCLVTASDDGSVRLWDVGSLELKMINSGVKESQKITAVDWSQSNPDIVVSVSDQAILHCWDLPSNKLRKVNVGPKVSPTCLAVCPHDKQIVAVGAKNGLVLIVSFKGEGGVKFRMRSHDSDVISLSWCPVKYNIFHEDAKLKDLVSPTSNGVQNGEGESKDKELDRPKGESQNENKISDLSESLPAPQVPDDKKKFELLLASGGKDRTIYFWRAGTDGRYETFLNFPTQPFVSGYRSKMVGEKGGNNIWGCMRWVDPYTLLSGSQFGELLSWDLSTLKSNKTEKDKKNQPLKKVKLLHGNHSKGVFCIACPIESSKPAEERRLIWTTALDRKLIACSLKSGKIVTELSTIGGIVYYMAVSPLDPNRIAIGVGDGKILIWNMGCTSKLDVSVHWQKINSKVMALDWHPTEESWLAFGTGEGRVGLLDVNSNKPPVIFRQHHHKSVYRVLWASHIKGKDASHTGKYEFALFSVGDGEVLQHSVNTPEKEPVKLNDILKKADESSKIDKTPGRTEFVMNHDRSLISVGNENGIIYILDGKTHEKCLVLMAFKKIVQCLAWHPASVTSDPSGLSPYSNWLAAASDGVKVFSISSDGKASETVAVLSLQTEKIVDISWSPHLNGHIVSVSYDYTAQVWDVIKQAPLVNYSKHHNAVLCAVWSPLNPEFIITGSSDNTLRVWKISEQPDARPSEKKKHRVSNFMKRITNVPEAVSAPELAQPNIRRDHSSSSVNSSQSKNSTSTKSQVSAEDLNPVTEWESGQLKRVKGKSLFPVSGSALNVSKHLDEYYRRWKINKNKKEEKVSNSETSAVDEASTSNTITGVAVMPPEKEKEFVYFDFFDDRKAMRQLMKVEEDQLRKENRSSLASLCSLWGGNITELIKDAINRKCLNDNLMSLAPMSSYRMWQEACVVYSEQLANQGDFMKAASYLLAVHKVEEAVELLSEHKYHREAVALAKCRLPNDDPVIHKVVRQYAEYAVSNGMLSLAAHCYLSLDDPLAASQMLARCKDLKSLKMAALLASEANATEIADTLAKEAFCSSLMAGDFGSCSDILSVHPNLEFLKIWIKTNKMLSEKKKLDLSTLISWLQGRGIDTEPILDKVKEDVKSFDSCYNKLKSNVNCFNALDTEKQLWLYISSHLSLAGAADSYAVSLHHLVQSLAAAYRFQMLNNKNDVLMHICILLSPKGPLAEKSIFMHRSDCTEEKNLISSMHGFLFSGIVSWLNENLEEVKDCIVNKESSSEIDYKNTFKWLDSVIDVCREDIFDRRNIEYFKNETMIKNLELKVASSQCNIPNDKREQRVVLTAVRGKNRKAKKESKESGDSVSDDTKEKDVDLIGTDEKVIEKAVINKDKGGEKEAVSTVKEKENAVIDVKEVQVNKNADSNLSIDSVKENSGNLDLGSKSNVENKTVGNQISLSENSLDLDEKVNVASKLDTIKSHSSAELKTETDNSELKSKLSVKVVSYGDDEKNVPSSPTLVIEFNSDEDSTALQKLNAVRSKFESEKVSSPNPFFVYCQLQNILTLLLKDSDPEHYEIMNNKVQDSWKNANV